jgi:hypothetical protein
MGQRHHLWRIRPRSRPHPAMIGLSVHLRANLRGTLLGRYRAKTGIPVEYLRVGASPAPNIKQGVSLWNADQFSATRPNHRSKTPVPFTVAPGLRSRHATPVAWSRDVPAKRESRPSSASSASPTGCASPGRAPRGTIPMPSGGWSRWIGCSFRLRWTWMHWGQPSTRVSRHTRGWRSTSLHLCNPRGSSSNSPTPTPTGTHFPAGRCFSGSTQQEKHRALSNQDRPGDRTLRRGHLHPQPGPGY